MSAGRWVLLRGLMRDARHWGDFPLRLQVRLGGEAPLCPDLPGNGSRWRETSPTGVSAYVADLRARLLAMGGVPPYRVLALSFGAMVATAWAERHPGELRDLVLVNTSLRPYSQPWQRLRPAAWPGLVRLLAGSPPPEVIEREILALTVNVPVPALLPQWVAWQRAMPVQRANVLRQLVAAARYRAPAVAPSVHLSILRGACDRLVDPACSDRLAQAWGLPLQTHPTAGHDLAQDAPEWLLERLGGSRT